MRNRNRSTSLNLLLKQRNHTPTTPKHIPKPHRNKLSLTFLRQVLNNHLRKPLRRPHHIRRINSLIRRNKNKILNPKGIRSLCHIPRPKNIILHSFRRIILHQRHMLMCRRMIHNIWFILFHKIKNSLTILNISNNRNNFKLICILPFQFHINLYKYYFPHDLKEAIFLVKILQSVDKFPNQSIHQHL